MTRERAENALRIVERLLEHDREGAGFDWPFVRAEELEDEDPSRAYIRLTWQDAEVTGPEEKP